MATKEKEKEETAKAQCTTCARPISIGTGTRGGKKLCPRCRGNFYGWNARGEKALVAYLEVQDFRIKRGQYFLHEYIASSVRRANRKVAESIRRTVSNARH